MIDLNSMDCQPEAGATLIGRAWLPEATPGPVVIVVRDGEVFDLTGLFPTTSELLNENEPAALVAGAGEPLCSLEELLARSGWDRRSEKVLHLLPPCDLQAIKACGVTFMTSLLERVIEEKAGGDPGRADGIRASLSAELGGDLRRVRPGSGEAQELKRLLQAGDMWSQYLEVAIGPDAEVFTKAQPLSAVGHGMDIGIHPQSQWNNPEPEIVLAVNASGTVTGVTLGNDVNLRDVEGRSALLLGRAKDNNGSCAIGPFIRLLDDDYTMDDVRSAVIRLRVGGEDGFLLEAESSMDQISRDPLDLVAQAVNTHHAFPDGCMLFLGTMFAPVQDREAPGMGFTHKVGDRVEVSTPRIGRLLNRVQHSDRVPRWNFGAGRLMRNLARRGLI